MNITTKLLTLAPVLGIALLAPSSAKQQAELSSEYQVVAGTSSSSQTTGRRDPGGWRIAKNPTYSEAVWNHQLPEAVLSNAEDDFNKAAPGVQQHVFLPRLAKLALEAGMDKKAEEYASRALQLAPKYETRYVLENGHPVSNSGEAVFYGHIVLGRLALQRGEMVAAKDHLLRAGQTFGSPNLDVWGPNMSLARELLKADERETVLQFLEECKTFWKLDRGRLAKWADEIRSGTIPDFELNLIL
jgi:hypothetical protein